MMNELYLTLDNVVHEMIHYNKERQQYLSKHGMYQRGLSDTVFSREYQTISYNPGRQCGKTMFIAKNMGIHDIAYTHNTATASELIHRVKMFNPVHTANVFCINGTKSINHDIDVLWINDASCIDKNEIDNIYNMYAGKCNQFILLG